MTALLLKGHPLSARIRSELAPEIERFRKEYGIAPTLAVVRVGNPPAAVSYTHSIDRAFTDCGLGFQMHVLPEDVTGDQLLARLDELERAVDVHGILLQRPLPKGIDVRTIMARFPADKDVEGVSPPSIGSLALDAGDAFRASTPSAAIELLNFYGIPIAGRRALVVGRSGVLGMPMALLLLRANATIIVAHSHTTGLDDLLRQSDLIIAAAGKPGLITAEAVTPGAVVVDFGVTVKDGHLVGDVDFDSVQARAGAITPVPGGTGPVASAILMRNTVRAAQRLAVPIHIKGKRKWLPIWKSPSRR